MKRRSLLLGMGAALTAGPQLLASESHAALRIGLTPVFLDDQAAFLNRWRDYLQQRSGVRIQFIQRSSYREIVEQVVSRDLDMAWLCGFPYITEKSRLRLMAVPLFQGKPEYHSYLIAQNNETASDLLALADKVMVFSDPNSFSGYLYPRYRMQQAGLSPDSHFRRSFFTWSHRKVVEAVSVGLADAGSVAGYVWETMSRLFPEVTARTRVIARSDAYAFPPFVARADLDPVLFARIQNVFLEMRQDVMGARLLEELNLDGFVPAESGMFDSIEAIVDASRIS
jgi:phosphonate transport system substrate-binding protein